MKKMLYGFIFCRLMGWKITGTINPKIKKCVIIVIPHTSWHDFYLGLLTRGIIGLEMNFVAKKELFKFPFGSYFRWMGGAPIDRSGGLNKVDSIAAIFKKKQIFRMAISPEGTRKKVDKLKTGFYYIAVKAKVPIIPVGFDYQKKEVKIGEALYPTGDFTNDMKKIMPHFTGMKGKILTHSFEYNLHSL